MKKIAKKVQVFAVISAILICMFSGINPYTEKVYADGSTPCITSGVYSVDEGNMLIGELQSNTVQVDTFKSSLNASPEGATCEIYANDGITPKTGFIVNGDKVKVSYNGSDRVYTVETYQIVNGEKIYPGYVANMSGTGAAPGDDDATDQPVPLGFNFNFFGNSFNSAYIDINGFISFDGLSIQKTDVLNYADVFTRNSVPYNMISAFLSDITMQNISEVDMKVSNPQYIPSIYYKTIGIAPNRQFIVQWTNMYFWQGSIQFADIQVILNEGSDKIQLQYRTLLDTDSPYYGTAHAGLGADATVGLKGPARSDTSSDQISYMIGGKNSSGQNILLHQGQAITFTPDANGGYTIADDDAQYEKVYLQNPLAPSVSLISESAGMTPDKATGVSKNAKIGWQGSSLADRYRLAVATADTFSNIVYNIDGITDTYFQFDGSHPLQSDTTYYWKVESVNNNGSSFSPVYSFTTAEDCALAELSSDSGTWNALFAPETTEYTINVPNDTSSIAFTPTAEDASSIIKVNGDTVTNGTSSNNIDLNVGSNTVVILVTAPDSTSKTYTITVNRISTPAPDLTGITWTQDSTSGTTQATAVPAGTLKYVIGAAGSQARPNVGDSAAGYTNTLTANTDIAVNSGDHIYIVSVDGNGNVLAWTDVTVSDGNIKPTLAPDLTGIIWTQGSTSGTTQATAVPAGTLKYVIGAAGSQTRPNVGDSAAVYTNTLTANTDIAVNPGDHIYIVSVDGNGNALAWTDATVSNGNILSWTDVTVPDGNIKPQPVQTTPAPVITTVNGSVVDSNTGKEVSAVPVKVTTDSNGNSEVTVNASQIIVFNEPDGEKNTLSDKSKIALSTTADMPVTMSSDGTIQIFNLAKGTQHKLDITYDLGGGEKIIIGTIDINVDNDGKIDFTTNLIDPYGVLTDSLSGGPISGAHVTIYYADTDRNRASGKVPNSAVQLPPMESFKPNGNKNPQETDNSGAYGFMVYPNTDYYMVISKDGYDTFKSPLITVGNELVKYSARLNPTVNGIKRVAGDNRIDTAIQLAKSEFKKKVNNIVLARADNYPDALTGSVLAYQQNAPIILVGNTQEDKNKVYEYMKDNADPAGNVYILGGAGAVGEDVVKQIKSAGFANIIRLGGKDRYETSTKIADYLKVAQGTPIILVSGKNYPDALSVSSSAAINQYPILLVNNDVIDNSVKDVLASVKPSKVYIIGEQGVIRDYIKNEVEQLTALNSDNIVRLGGEDRYKTSVAIAKYFNLPGHSICVTTGTNFPDAIAGSIYAANFNAPIILVDRTLDVDDVYYLKNKKITGITIFGGASAVNKNIELMLLQLIGN